MTIQLAKTNKETIGVYRDHSEKIGHIKPSDVAQAFDWNGADVLNFFAETLVECNYHTEAIQIKEMIKLNNKTQFDFRPSL